MIPECCAYVSKSTMFLLHLYGLLESTHNDNDLREIFFFKTQCTCFAWNSSGEEWSESGNCYMRGLSIPNRQGIGKGDILVPFKGNTRTLITWVTMLWKKVSRGVA